MPPAPKGVAPFVGQVHVAILGGRHTAAVAPCAGVYIPFNSIYGFIIFVMMADEV